MKCIKHVKSEEVLRLSNQIAAEKVDTGEWDYCTKSEYKKNLNPLSKSVMKRLKSQKGGDKDTSK